MEIMVNRSVCLNKAECGIERTVGEQGCIEETQEDFLEEMSE